MIWPSVEFTLEAARQNLPSLPPLRDPRLLESALGSAQSLEAYASNDPFEIAAHLVVGVIRNHPFVDGNKRFAWIAGCTLLELNDLSLGSPTRRGHRLATELLKEVAAGRAGTGEIASFFAGMVSARHQNL